MGLLRTIALAILGFSTFVFVVLFGRLPFFRKTPIGLLHRIIWIHIPNGISFIDSRLFGGRVLSCWRRAGSYIFYENHPLVLVFFTSLLIIGELIFIPSAWLRVSMVDRACIPIAIALPYIFLYLSVVTKSFITQKNHDQEMKRYPYDKVIFHPGHQCTTCKLLKPARSKHCSFCKGCIARHDHHCIWLTNCVGLNNYQYFLSLLLSLSVMLAYGSFLGYSILSQTYDRLIPRNHPVRMRKQSWTTFFNICASVVAADARIGGVTMLMFMTAPLAFAFLVYHIYLIWAGMTTNESAKWSDWKDDVADGIAFKLIQDPETSDSPLLDPPETTSSWPVTSDQVLVFTDGEPPKKGYKVEKGSNEVLQPRNPDAAIDPRFVQVRSMKEIDNIYDLGFWNNLRHVFNIPAGRDSRDR
ncbi:DHHC palmitoyltransferase-domain-containing protein [Aspergillus granulosus]|uniref:Palmitoyltransferase n=1 Tax=Aspergillus granulosus TaxID=176169 RepID=A0ABR4I3W5_9EURO